MVLTALHFTFYSLFVTGTKCIKNLFIRFFLTWSSHLHVDVGLFRSVLNLMLFSMFEPRFIVDHTFFRFETSRLSPPSEVAISNTVAVYPTVVSLPFTSLSIDQNNMWACPIKFNNKVLKRSKDLSVITDKYI